MTVYPIVSNAHHRETEMESNSVVSITPKENGKNHSGKRELTSAYSVVVDKGTELTELIVVRCWMGRSSSAMTVYATIWIHGENYASGTGSAGGGGYHKESAAIGEAITSAGIQLKHRIDGVGDSAIRDALEAITKHFGYHKFVIVSH